MNINNVYSDRHLISDEFVSMFESDQKNHLNSIELIGLEAILAAFIRQYEEEEYSEAYAENITDFTRYNENCVDICDGCYDTYIFGKYAIGDVWMTNNGIPMLSCYLLESDEYDDPWEIVKNIDWVCNCKHVLFRLG